MGNVSNGGRRILATVANCLGPCTVAAVAIATKETRATAQRRLDWLVKDGLLSVVTKSGRRPEYHLSDDPRLDDVLQYHYKQSFFVIAGVERQFAVVEVDRHSGQWRGTWGTYQVRSEAEAEAKKLGQRQKREAIRFARKFSLEGE